MSSGHSRDGSSSWTDQAAALSLPEGLWLLDTLVNDHSLTFADFELAKLGAAGAVALGQLMRAHYVVEGESRLHATDFGRAAYATYLDEHPEMAELGPVESD